MSFLSDLTVTRGQEEGLLYGFLAANGKDEIICSC